jgi:predicted peptidase
VIPSTGTFQTQTALDLPYRLWHPDNLSERSNWPLIVALHGSDERGTDLAAVARHGLARLLHEGLRLPAVACAPQCPPDRTWDPEPVAALVRHLIATLPVDPARVVLTGHSMGGYGTWHTGVRYPNLFAGLLPICGGGLVWLADRIARTGVPVWAWHGLDDTLIRPYHSREMVDAVQAAGGRARLTELPGVGHNAWDAAYTDPDVQRWLVRPEQRSD